MEAEWIYALVGAALGASAALLIDAYVLKHFFEGKHNGK
jgi:hypothetical protein